MHTAFIVEDDILDLPDAQRVAQFNKRFFREASKRWVTDAAKRIVQEAQRTSGYEIDPISWLKDPNFSIREAGKQLRGTNYRLSESLVTSMIYSLANIATVASAATNYQLRPVVYRSLCEVIPSKKSEETYLSLQRGDIPLPVSETEGMPESKVGGVLTRIKNYKFGRIWAISRDLEEDDQTGQIAKIGQMIGEGMSYSEEFWALTTFFYAYQAANIRPTNGETGSGIIPARCIAGQTANDGGPTTTAGDITIANVENLLMGADYVTDLQSNYALVNPNSILGASSRRFAMAKIFRSAINPGGAATTPGSLSGAFAINPLAGELTVYHSPMVSRVRAGLDSTNPPWAVGEAGRGWVFQDREPLEVMQEAENAGDSFKSDTRRIRAKRRFGSGVRYGEFWLAGN